MARNPRLNEARYLIQAFLLFAIEGRQWQDRVAKARRHNFFQNAEAVGLVFDMNDGG